jgi:hypothetical protein
LYPYNKGKQLITKNKQQANQILQIAANSNLCLDWSFFIPIPKNLNREKEIN